jgi:hypothetical protein
MVATDARGARPRFQNFVKLLGDALESVLNRQRIDGEIAKVADSPFFEWVDIQHGIPRANDRRLITNVSRSEPRSRAIGSAAIVGNPDQGDVEFLGPGDVGQAHERGNPREARVDQRVNRPWSGFYRLF